MAYHGTSAPTVPQGAVRAPSEIPPAFHPLSRNRNRLQDPRLSRQLYWRVIQQRGESAHRSSAKGCAIKIAVSSRKKPTYALEPCRERGSGPPERTSQRRRKWRSRSPTESITARCIFPLLTNGVSRTGNIDYFSKKMACSRINHLELTAIQKRQRNESREVVCLNHPLKIHKPSRIRGSGRRFV